MAKPRVIERNSIADEIKGVLTEIFKTRPAGPFLFVGSGLSRRYLGLEDWKGMLARFSVTGRPFEYYLAHANGDYPLAATRLAEDFNEHWWAADEYKPSVERFKSRVVDSSSALRFEISNYLLTLDQTKAKQSEFEKEVELLATLNVDGVITTNWDVFLEQVFPDYRVYVGQQELLFSNPQEIGEIYKIHGCAKQPASMVLTAQDYKDFNDRNAYLAAKLITIFVEHPIVFLGYSITDPNISSLLRAISLCIGKENIEQLRQNLIFVERLRDGDREGVSDTYLAIDGVQIPLVHVKTNDFIPIYEAINVTKRKIPARVLRFCKEQLYEIVQSSEPEKKICVVGLDEIEKKEDVEFLVGVGVVSEQEEEIRRIGYMPIQAADLFEDVLHDNRGFDASALLENTIKHVGKGTPYVPVFKYLRAVGIDGDDKYKASGLQLDKWAKREIKKFRSDGYKTGFFKQRHKSMTEIIKECTPENASVYIPFLAKEKIDLDELRTFLVKHQDKFDYATSSSASNFRKLACLYDWYRWGWQ